MYAQLFDFSRRTLTIGGDYLKKYFDWDEHTEQNLLLKIKELIESVESEERSFFQTKDETLIIRAGLSNISLIVNSCNNKNPPFIRVLFKYSDSNEKRELWLAIAEKILRYNDLPSIHIMYESCDRETGHISEERWWILIKSDDGTITKSNIW